MGFDGEIYLTKIAISILCEDSIRKECYFVKENLKRIR
jgi:hypothetical protein